MNTLECDYNTVTTVQYKDGIKSLSCLEYSCRK